MKPTDNILFISNSIVGKEPGLSGGESRFIEVGKVWEKQGHKIFLLSSLGGATLCEKMGLKVRPIILTDSERTDRFEFISRTFRLLYFLPKLKELFKEGIVYSTSEQIYDVIPGVFLKLVFGKKIKFAVAVHWLPPILFWQRKSSTLLNSLLFLISERVGLYLAARFSDVMFPVSVSTFNDLVKANLTGRKSVVVKCGVNYNEIQNYSNSVIKEPDTAVFLKRLQRVKGIFDAIDIWEDVIKTNEKSKLTIVGSGIDGEEAEEIVSQKNLVSHINFYGVVYDMKEKFKLIARSRLFILPSYEENWAIVIGESLAAGTPVICYDLKELRDVWHDSVVFVPLGDKKAFAQKVSELMNNDLEYKILREKGLDYVKQYDWENIALDEMNYIKNERS